MKTNYLKTILSSRLIIVVLFLSSFSAAFGQELIRNTMDMFCDTSIIRVKRNDSILIYNDNRENASFVLMRHPNTLDAIYIDPVYVNDFEIWKKKVYFCGYKYEYGIRRAVFGSFDITSFPGTNIYYRVLDTCTEFKKLDVFEVEEQFGYNELHLVMTGSTGTRSDVIAEYSNSVTFPNSLRVYFSNDEREDFDDVAVIKNYVVVSSRKMRDGTPFVVFREYIKPTMTGTSIFWSPYHEMRVSSPYAITPVFLEHKEQNDYSAVYREGGFMRMAMLLLQAPTSSYTCVEIFDDSTHTIHPMDIKYNWKSEVYDILAREENVQNRKLFPPMQIYHVTPAVVNHQTSTGDGTFFTPDSLEFNCVWSIDPLNGSNYFVGSGSCWFYTEMYRYKHNEWVDCPKRFTYRFDVGDLKGSEEMVETLEYKQYFLPSIEYKPETRKIDFPVDCGKW